MIELSTLLIFSESYVNVFWYRYKFSNWFFRKNDLPHSFKTIQIQMKDSSKSVDGMESDKAGRSTDQYMKDHLHQTRRVQQWQMWTRVCDCDLG